MRKITLILSLVIFAFVQQMVSQDARYSQYFVVPTWLNPALSGNYDGNYRLAAIYRDQWRSPLENPLSTFGFSADTKFQLQKNKHLSDDVSAGLILMNDRSNVNDFNTNHISLNLAYHKLLDLKSQQYLSGGLVIGITQLGFGYQDATFEDQFNGFDNYSGATSEIFPPNSLAFMELGLGGVYRVRPGERTTYYLGASAFHLTGPNISFFDLVEEINVPFETSAKLSQRYTTYLAAAIDFGKTVTLTPRLLFLNQGTVTEFNGGVSFRKLFYTTRKSAVHLGAYVSVADHLESYHLNSFTALIGFEVEELVLGFSFEQTLDKLNNFFGFNAFEISLAYTGNLNNTGSYCPTF